MLFRSTEFLDKTLKNGTAVFTSIPPAIALAIFKNTDPKNSVQFASELQKAIYYDGIEPENLDSYGQIAAKFGLDAVLFTSKMKDPLYKKLAEVDFKKSADLNVSGFPTVFLEIEGIYHKIGSGYMPFGRLENSYLTIKNKLK